MRNEAGRTFRGWRLHNCGANAGTRPMPTPTGRTPARTHTQIQCNTGCIGTVTWGMGPLRDNALGDACRVKCVPTSIWRGSLNLVPFCPTHQLSPVPCEGERGGVASAIPGQQSSDSHRASQPGSPKLALVGARKRTRRSEVVPSQAPQEDQLPHSRTHPAPGREKWRGGAQTGAARGGRPQPQRGRGRRDGTRWKRASRE